MCLLLCLSLALYPIPLYSHPLYRLTPKKYPARSLYNTRLCCAVLLSDVTQYSLAV